MKLSELARDCGLVSFTPNTNGGATWVFADEDEACRFMVSSALWASRHGWPRCDGHLSGVTYTTRLSRTIHPSLQPA